MNEQHYRAFDHFNGMYFYSHTITLPTLASFFAYLQNFVNGGNEITLELGTGLKDIVEKEIFQGDVIKLDYEDDLASITVMGVVEWNKSGYWEVTIESRGFSTAIFSNKISGIRVIGNTNFKKVKNEHP